MSEIYTQIGATIHNRKKKCVSNKAAKTQVFFWEQNMSPHKDLYQEVMQSFGILFGIYWVIIVPWILFQLKLYWNHRRLPIIKKRKYRLSMIYVTSILFTSAIVRPALWVVSIIRHVEIFVITMTVTLSCLFISAVMFLFRTFIITFEFNYNLAVFKKRCLAAVLSPEFEYQNWWLAHKQTFGDIKFLTPYVIFLLFILCVIGVALFVVNVDWCRLFVFINFMLIVLFYGFLSRYIASHRDQFVVKKEIIYTALVWLVLITIYGIMFYFPQKWLNIDGENRDMILYIVEVICATTSMLIRYSEC